LNLKFTKMHGAGNDFVVLDGVRQDIELSPAQLRLLADRHFGVGCDQILIVEKAVSKEADFHYRIFNADGGEVEQCGNGARCFLRFVHDQKLTTKREIVVETRGGLISPRLESLAIADDMLDVSVLSMGNPHAVLVVDDIESAQVVKLGPMIEHHPRFPKRVNAGFMQVMDRHSIRLRVYERGAGETLSCGTGACAAVVAGIRRSLLDSPVSVATRGGVLSITWNGNGQPVQMTGPAITVFAGEINL
jgi:diaminopimelate epimerase